MPVFREALMAKSVVGLKLELQDLFFSSPGAGHEIMLLLRIFICHFSVGVVHKVVYIGK